MSENDTSGHGVRNSNRRGGGGSGGGNNNNNSSKRRNGNNTANNNNNNGRSSFNLNSNDENGANRNNTNHNSNRTSITNGSGRWSLTSHATTNDDPYHNFHGSSTSFTSVTTDEKKFEKNLLQVIMKLIKDESPARKRVSSRLIGRHLKKIKFEEGGKEITMLEKMKLVYGGLRAFLLQQNHIIRLVNNNQHQLEDSESLGSSTVNSQVTQVTYWVQLRQHALLTSSEEDGKDEDVVESEQLDQAATQQQQQQGQQQQRQTQEKKRSKGDSSSSNVPTYISSEEGMKRNGGRGQRSNNTPSNSNNTGRTSSPNNGNKTRPQNNQSTPRRNNTTINNNNNNSDDAGTKNASGSNNRSNNDTNSNNRRNNSNNNNNNNNNNNKNNRKVSNNGGNSSNNNTSSNNDNTNNDGNNNNYSTEDSLTNESSNNENEYKGGGNTARNKSNENDSTPSTGADNSRKGNNTGRSVEESHSQTPCNQNGNGNNCNNRNTNDKTISDNINSSNQRHQASSDENIDDMARNQACSSEDATSSDRKNQAPRNDDSNMQKENIQLRGNESSTNNTSSSTAQAVVLSTPTLNENNSIQDARSSTAQAVVLSTGTLNDNNFKQDTLLENLRDENEQKTKRIEELETRLIEEKIAYRQLEKKFIELQAVLSDVRGELIVEMRRNSAAARAHPPLQSNVSTTPRTSSPHQQDSSRLRENYDRQRSLNQNNCHEREARTNGGETDSKRNDKTSSFLSGAPSDMNRALYFGSHNTNVHMGAASLNGATRQELAMGSANSSDREKSLPFFHAAPQKPPPKGLPSHPFEEDDDLVDMLNQIPPEAESPDFIKSHSVLNHVQRSSSTASSVNSTDLLSSSFYSSWLPSVAAATANPSNNNKNNKDDSTISSSSDKKAMTRSIDAFASSTETPKKCAATEETRERLEAELDFVTSAFGENDFSYTSSKVTRSLYLDVSDRTGSTTSECSVLVHLTVTVPIGYPSIGVVSVSATVVDNDKANNGASPKLYARAKQSVMNALPDLIEACNNEAKGCEGQEALLSVFSVADKWVQIDWAGIHQRSSS